MKRPIVLFSLLVLSLLVAMTLLSVIVPLTSQAQQPLGFTSTPTSQPTNTPVPATPIPTSPPPPPDDDDDDDERVSYEIDITLRCNLSCPLEIPALQVAVPVQFIHIGSGWIAEGTISNGGSTKTSVPYPGQWQVFMTGSPQFTPAVAVDYPTAYPVLLGTVLADGGRQSVDCPFSLSCLEPPPDSLPQAGAEQPARGLKLFAFIGGGLILISFGIISRLFVRRIKAKQVKSF